MADKKIRKDVIDAARKAGSDCRWELLIHLVSRDCYLEEARAAIDALEALDTALAKGDHNVKSPALEPPGVAYYERFMKRARAAEGAGSPVGCEVAALEARVAHNEARLANVEASGGKEPLLPLERMLEARTRMDVSENQYWEAARLVRKYPELAAKMAEASELADSIIHDIDQQLEGLYEQT